MSQENVKIVREIYDVWNRSLGVPPLDLIDPEIEAEIVGGLDAGSYRGHAGGKTSGVEVDLRGWHTWTLRDGKAVRWRIFGSRGEALEAVGLSGHDARADS